MTHDQLLHDKASLIYELGEARANWLAEVAFGGVGDMVKLDALLDEYIDLNVALTHEEMTDYD